MAKTSLRTYNREIDGMIESGHLEESVAHCQHILKIFPMHLETYRLLGKSLLEERRYADAADIFQRVLMAVPDDFVAQVGMSIIRDDEGKLDDAIWHMERAFESQPSNTAIQGELRRLYGRRDGVEPPKIRLSRDALANMYAQGELFDQAIAEIHSVLAEDPNRPDLQVMLAIAYYRSGQKVESAEIAANLLNKFTYCLDALRILVDVLPSTTSAENTQVYRERLCQLDPYSAYVSGSVFSTNQVPNEAVELERLEYTASAAHALPQPNWASSLGIKLIYEKNEEPVLEEMKTGDSLEKSQVVTLDSSKNMPVPVVDEQAIEQPSEPLVQTDIPDQLTAMASKELTEAVEVGSIPVLVKPTLPDEGDIPAWLPEPGKTEGLAGIEPSQPAAYSQKKEAFPEWLKEIDDTTTGDTTGAKVTEALEQSNDEEPPLPTQPVQPSLSAKTPVESRSQIPSAGDQASLQMTSESKPLKDETLAWLESLTIKQDVKEKELLNKPENQQQEIPDWLSLINEAPAVSVTQEPHPTPSEKLPLELLKSLGSESKAPEATSSDELIPPVAPDEGTAQPLNIEEDTKAWLESLDAKQGAKEEGFSTKPENFKEEVPDWLRPIVDQSVSPVIVKPPSLLSDILPLESPTKTAGDVADHETALSEEPPAGFEKRQEEIPDWLRPVIDQPSSHAVVQPSPTLRETQPMKSLAAPIGDETGHEAIPSEELPAFLIKRMEENPDRLISDQDQPPSPTTPLSTPEASGSVPLQALSIQAGEETAPGSVLSEEFPAQIPPADENVQALKIENQEPNKEPVPLDVTAAPEVSQVDVPITSWLNKLDVEEDPGKQIPAQEVPAPETAPLDDLPDWLKNPETPAIPEGAPKPAEDLPDWMRLPAQPGNEGATTVPTLESPQESEMPAWIDEEFSVTEQPEPTAPGEWVPVNEKATPIPVIEPIAEPLNEIVSEIPAEPQIPIENGMPARVISTDEDSEILTSAQAALNENKPNEAMKAYTTLIKKNRLLDKIILDLTEATKRFPLDINLWQTLGDASMRANHLQDALDAYTKAEELLR